MICTSFITSGNGGWGGGEEKDTSTSFSQDRSLTNHLLFGNTEKKKFVTTNWLQRIPFTVWTL